MVMGMAKGLGDGLLRFCNGAWRDNDGDAVDIVEVVRCKDCRFMKMLDPGYRYCLVWRGVNSLGDDGFCNYGERKSDDA